MMAPETQTHVPAIMWFGDRFQLNRTLLKSKSIDKYSHDNIYHTVLGFMEVETESYNKILDVLKP